MRKTHVALLFIALIVVPLTHSQTSDTGAGRSDTITLPAPVKSGGMSLAEALSTRRSIRGYRSTVLTQSEISQLVWAAQGITDDRGHRTAPSAHAQYFLTIYMATSEGLFRYLPEGHRLQKLSAIDVRAKLSPQPSVLSAPAVFIVAGDYERAIKAVGAAFGPRCVELEAGHVTQNLLLQAVAIKLGGVPVGGITPADVAKAASLPETSQPIYLVPVGHPK